MGTTIFLYLILSRKKEADDDETFVKYYGAMYTDKGFFMYLEYVSGGTLEARIDQLGRLDSNLAKIYTSQMLQGLIFIHSNQVIHRDLKPSNVLISVDGQIKLADFGTAFDMNNLTHTVQQTLCGTPAYIAPEVVRKDKHTTSTDIWSLGAIMYNMLTGELPFTAVDKYSLLLQIANGSVTIRYTEDCPPEFQKVIKRCLQFKPSERPSAETLLCEPLFAAESSTGTIINPSSRVAATPKTMLSSRERSSDCIDREIFSSSGNIIDAAEKQNSSSIQGTETSEPYELMLSQENIVQSMTLASSTKPGTRRNELSNTF